MQIKRMLKAQYGGCKCGRHKFKVRLSYMVSPCLKETTKEIHWEAWAEEKVQSGSQSCFRKTLLLIRLSQDNVQERPNQAGGWLKTQWRPKVKDNRVWVWCGWKVSLTEFWYTSMLERKLVSLILEVVFTCLLDGIFQTCSHHTQVGTLNRLRPGTGSCELSGSELTHGNT